MAAAFSNIVGHSLQVSPNISFARVSGSGSCPKRTGACDHKSYTMPKTLGEEAASFQKLISVYINQIINKLFKIHDTLVSSISINNNHESRDGRTQWLWRQVSLEGIDL